MLQKGQLHLSVFLFILLIISLGSISAQNPENQHVWVVLEPSACSVQQLAAKELIHYLERMYPEEIFHQSYQMPKNGRVILMGTDKIFSRQAFGFRGEISCPTEGFVIKTFPTNPNQTFIVGSDAGAVLHAVYALLEHLGCGFYLSYDAIPLKKGNMDFNEWNFYDSPLVPVRIVFNWHNFLSGCTGWNLEDWKQWVYNSTRMRYTDIMVHAYKNNPMQPFEHNGIEKQVGYIATSAKGRDWSTMHLNDVRRIPGCVNLFDDAVFGSQAAMVPDEKRIEAATSLMNEVFDFAESMAMRINFAIDVDTGDDPAILETLPSDATFTAESRVLVNPDTPEGYRYYRSMIKSLLETYPQIGRVVVWHRWNLSTPWTRLKPEDFPNNQWRKEFSDMVSKHPHLGDDPYAGGQFGIAKIVSVFRQALNELGYTDLPLAVGTWRFDHLKAADVFMPEDVTFMALDYGIEFESDKIKDILSELQHKMIPIVWAHHDDGHYLGRPYTPFSDFFTKLKERNADGFGIIHWTMRPLDLYFKSHAEQVWKSSKDRTIQKTCQMMAERIFGKQHREVLGDYLYNWVISAPIFGRETLDYFMWGPFDDAETLLALSRKRLDILETISTLNMSDRETQRLSYFIDYEKFCMDFIIHQNRLWDAKNLIDSRIGNWNQYQNTVVQLDVEQTLKKYARAIKHGNTTQSERGLASTLATQWIPYLIEQQQLAGIEPVRVNFYPTHHEDIAHMPGQRAFFIDKEGRYWRCAGERETNNEIFDFRKKDTVTALNTLEEIAQTGLIITKPFKFSMNSILHGPTSDGRFIQGEISPGTYRLHILVRRHKTGELEPYVFDLKLPAQKISKTIDMRKFVDTDSELVQLTYPLQVEAGVPEFIIEPLNGVVLVCGAWLDPITLSLPEPYGMRVKRVTSKYQSPDDFLPEKTLDGNLKTYWVGQKHDDSIQYDFGRIRNVQEIRIAWMRGDQKKWAFEIETSDDGNYWESVFQGVSSGYTKRFENYAFDQMVAAQYVRIYNHGKTHEAYLGIANIEFHQNAIPVPAGLKIYDLQASDRSSPEFAPERATDTNRATRWAAKGRDHWLQFRLDDTAIVETISIVWFDGGNRKYVFDVQISEDGENWKKAASYSSQGKIGSEEYKLNCIKAPWLRLLCRGNNKNDWNSIHEIEIHGRVESR